MSAALTRFHAIHLGVADDVEVPRREAPSVGRGLGDYLAGGRRLVVRSDSAAAWAQRSVGQLHAQDPPPEAVEAGFVAAAVTTPCARAPWNRSLRARSASCLRRSRDHAAVAEDPSVLRGRRRRRRGSQRAVACPSPPAIGPEPRPRAPETPNASISAMGAMLPNGARLLPHASAASAARTLSAVCSTSSGSSVAEYRVPRSGVWPRLMRRTGTRNDHLVARSHAIARRAIVIASVTVLHPDRVSAPHGRRTRSRRPRPPARCSARSRATRATRRAARRERYDLFVGGVETEAPPSKLSCCRAEKNLEGKKKKKRL